MPFNALLDVVFDPGDCLVKHGRLNLPRNPKTDQNARIQDKIAI